MATRQAAGTGAFAFVRKRVRSRNRRSGRGPKIAVAIVAFLAVLFAGFSAWAINYDNHTIDTLPSDTRVGGVQVGGLTYQAAVDKVRAKVEAPLHEGIHVSSDGFTADTTAWDMGLQVDVPAA